MTGIVTFLEGIVKILDKLIDLTYNTPIMNKAIKLTLAGLALVLAIAGPVTALAAYNSSAITKYATVGQYFEFDVYADGSSNNYSNLNYYATSLPAGANFNRNSRIFSWTPQTVGSYLAKFRVSDGYDYADLDVTIVVSNSNAYYPSNNNQTVPAPAPASAPDSSKIFIINTQPQETKTIYVPVESNENVDVDEVINEEEVIVNENGLTFADTIVGIFNNIILNPIVLLLVIVVLLVLLFFSKRKNDELEQELDMIRSRQRDNQRVE